jgi:hypothetical protein
MSPSNYKGRPPTTLCFATGTAEPPAGSVIKHQLRPQPLENEIEPSAHPIHYPVDLFFFIRILTPKTSSVV